jgi:hypothetical protein
LVGLTVDSGLQKFTITNSLSPKVNASFQKPFGNQGTFTNRYGDYPISLLRFAEADAASERIFAADIRQLNSNGLAQIADPKQPAPLISKRSISGIRATSTNSILSSMDLLGGRGQLIKRLRYEYDGADSRRLTKEKVLLPDRPVLVSLRDKGATVTVNGNSHQIKDFFLNHHQGGRTATIDYRRVSFDSNSVSLPFQIEVHPAAGGDLLRSAQLANFHRLKGPVPAAGFGGAEVQAEQSKAMELLYKYRRADRSVGKDDREKIQKLRAFFELPPTSSGTCIGDELHRINLLMDLNRILGDEQALERCFNRYLAILQKNRFYRTFLVGGCAVIENAASEGRIQVANRLLNQFASSACRAVDIETVHPFVVNEFRKRNFLLTIRLLDEVGDSCNQANRCFESAAISALASRSLGVMLTNREPLKGAARIQAELALAGTDGKQLESLEETSAARAMKFAKELTLTNAFQKKLLDELAKSDPHGSEKPSKSKNL